MTRKRGLAVLGAVGVVSFAAPAAAVDKATCAAAAEAGQHAQKERRYVDARDKLLVCSDRECPEVISKDCTTWLGEVERGMASVLLRPRDDKGQPASDTRVSIDGIVREHALDAAVELNPGPHTIRFERSGFESVEEHVEVAEGKRNQEVAVTFKAPTTIVVPPSTETTNNGNLLIASVVTGGVGLIGLGLFAGFAVAGQGDQDALKKTCAPYCTPDQIAPINTKFTIANASMVGGIVALVVAGVLFGVWTASHSDSKARSARPLFVF